MAMASIKTFGFSRKFLFEVKKCTIFTTAYRKNHNIVLRRFSPYKNNVSSSLCCKHHMPLVGIASVRWASQDLAVEKSLNSPISGVNQSGISEAALKANEPTLVWVDNEGAVTNSGIDLLTLPPVPTPTLDAGADTLADAASLLLKEPSLQSYGLGGWSPIGLAQRALEYFHIGLDLPWWGSIVVGTIVLRTVVFPLVILSQRNAAKMANHMPEMQRLQMKMTEARQSGNNFETARYAQELMVFMKDKKMNPITNILPPLAQAPLFISMFMGLRRMCNAPVESLQTGGLFWFTDLTVPDPYYILPIITSLTMSATIELGTDSARASTLGMMRYALRALPLIIFPFTINFPGAILCYWVSTNFISLIQVGILRIPGVRNYFKIEAIVSHPKTALAGNKGFVQGFKESIANMKITRELNDRQNIDHMNFNKAGRAPIQKTFKYDPTKPRPATTTELLAKKKS